MATGCTEELVRAHTQDGLALDGLLLTPAAGESRPVFVAWMHGAGVNFYYPSHIAIGRELAACGYPFVTGNNRGHDFGTTLGWRDGVPHRGGVGWERFADAPLDIAAWLHLAEARGHRRVALVGHSFGALKVIAYQAEHQDPRVAGVVVASAPVRRTGERRDPATLRLAVGLLAAGRGEEPVPWGSIRQAIGFHTLSAQTYADRAGLPDVLGVTAPDSPLARVRCPVFACYGSTDIGTAADLERMRRTAVGAPRFETRIFPDADHGYDGQEPAIAAALADWLGTLG
jgi:pimeloyl-ACP methyl ester carboxylesterase